MMNHHSLTEALENLPNNSGSISVSAQIARHYEAIDNAMSLGVRQKEIIETLQKNGVPINEKSFPTTWARLKKRNTKNPPEKISNPTFRLKPEEAEPSPEKQNETESKASPSTIDDIMKTAPDLNQLAKLRKTRNDTTNRSS